MTEEKKNQPKKQKEGKTQKEKTELDEELNQTFPASDPPSRTRPGHEREEEKEKEKKQ